MTNSARNGQVEKDRETMVLCCKKALQCKAPRDNARAWECPLSVVLSPLSMPPSSLPVHH